MSRVKASTAQINHLVEYMKVNHGCAAGRGNGLQGKVDLERQWQQLADGLNAMGGTMKTVDKWKQTWRDLRNAVKKKAIKNKKEQKGDGPGGTGNGPAQLHTFSAQDEAVMSPVDDGAPVVSPTLLSVAEVDHAELLTPVCSLLDPLADHSVPVSLTTAMSSTLAAPVCRTAVQPQVPPRSRKNKRRLNNNVETFEILEFEKAQLEVQKKLLSLEKKKLDIKKRRLSLEEAKVKAFERIATALEGKINKLDY